MKKILIGALLCSLGLSAACDTDCCNSFNGGVEWLHWNAHQDSTQFAASVGQTNSGNVTTVKPDILRAGSKYNNGFAVYLGYDFDCCAASRIKYSQINNFCSGSTTAPVGGNINLLDYNYPIFQAITSNNISLSSVENSLDSKFKQLDITLWSQNCSCCCGSLSFTPYLGLRGAWLHQKLKIDGVDDVTPASFSACMKSSLQAYGPQSGVELEYSLGCGFLIEGRFGGALFAAKSKAQENLNALIGTSNELIIAVNECCWHVTPAVDGYIGIAYEWDVCCKPVKVYLGYEMHTIFNASFFSLINYADYSTQGFTLGAGMSF